jgi:hypothetical protein
MNFGSFSSRGFSSDERTEFLLVQRTSLSLFTKWRVTAFIYTDSMHNIQTVCGIYREYMQYTESMCNIQTSYAIYRQYMQYTDSICNIQRAYAIYIQYMQYTDSICNIQAVYAIYRQYVQYTDSICNIQRVSVSPCLYSRFYSHKNMKIEIMQKTFNFHIFVWFLLAARIIF